MSGLNGGVNEKDHRALSLSHHADDAELGEYDGLVRYISKYQDARRGSIHGGVEEEAEVPKKKWYQRAGKAAGDGFETPEEWLKTVSLHVFCDCILSTILLTDMLRTCSEVFHLQRSRADAEKLVSRL